MCILIDKIKAKIQYMTTWDGERVNNYTVKVKYWGFAKHTQGRLALKTDAMLSNVNPI